MSYIGRDIRTGAFRQLDDISSGFDGSDTTHTMQVNSTNVTVGDVNQILLSLGGVIQKPGTDFTVSGSVLTFTTAPAANTSFFAVLLGSDNGGTVTPTDASVTTAKIVDDAVTGAKLADDIAITTTGNVSFDGGSFTFNESSADKDFRVESNGKANMLFVDGGNDRVNIGAATSVAATLVVAEGDSGIDSVSANANLLVVEKNDNCGMTILSATDAYASLHFGDSGDADIGQLRYDHTNNSMVFVVNAAERMRLDSSGHLNIGFASFSSTDTGLKLYADGQIYFVMNSSSSTNVQRFYNSSSGNIAGSINMNGDATAFNTSSDYRLKENVVDLENATDRLKQLKVKRFNFKSDTDTTLDGFLAHEVSSIVPEAITGEKDAIFPETKYEAGDDIPEGKKIGDVKEAEKINPQGIDQSKLVPLMVKTIQELEARIKTLEDA